MKTGLKQSLLTIEDIKELYYAHEFLVNQKGQYKDPAASDYISLTWQGYCESNGVSAAAANRWIQRYIPAQLSETGEERFLTPAEARTEREKAAAERLSRSMSQALASGKRRAG
jgi:hypothetical protein